MWGGKEFHILGAEIRKAREPNERSMTPMTETHHRHLSSACFFAVSYPSHMLLISCSLFLPLVRFPVILPSRTSRSNTSCHLRFRWFIVLMIQRFSLTRFRTSELLTFAVQLIFSFFLHIHISKVSILFISVLDIVHVSAGLLHTRPHSRHLTIRFLKSRFILLVRIFFFTVNFTFANPILLLISLSQYPSSVIKLPRYMNCCTCPSNCTSAAGQIPWKFNYRRWIL